MRSQMTVVKACQTWGHGALHDTQMSIHEALIFADMMRMLHICSRSTSSSVPRSEQRRQRSKQHGRRR